MANKRRPKKARVPYRKYGPDGVVMTNLSVKQVQKNYVSSYSDDEEEYDGASEGAVGSQKPFEPVVVDPAHRMALPVELLVWILELTGEMSPNYLLISRTLYSLCLPKLYEAPKLKPSNFRHFVETLSRPNARLVKCLDLSMIIQSGKNSYISRLLRRCSSSLRTFVAPQTSFGFSPLVSLRSCTELEVLDLRLVSETVRLSDLFHAIRNSLKLTHLSFPRVSFADDPEQFVTDWPPNLWYLRLSGGISNHFVTNSTFSSSITRLELTHCPILKEFSMYSLLTKFGTNLTHLSVTYPMPALGQNSLDFVFLYCPSLLFLQISVDYCTRQLFSEDLLPYPLNTPRPLRTLFVESSGGLGLGRDRLHPDDLTIALLEDRLPSLKTVRITHKLGWDFQSDDVADLVNILEERGGALYSSSY